MKNTAPCSVKRLTENFTTFDFFFLLITATGAQKLLFHSYVNIEIQVLVNKIHKVCLRLSEILLLVLRVFKYYYWSSALL